MIWKGLLHQDLQSRAITEPDSQLFKLFLSTDAKTGMVNSALNNRGFNKRQSIAVGFLIEGAAGVVFASFTVAGELDFLVATVARPINLL